MKSNLRWWPLLLGLIVVACGALPDESGQPTAAINSPVAGAELPVNMPVDVQVSASDLNGSGVDRVDLQVDGVVVDSFESPGPQQNVTAALSFTPTSEGARTLTAIAYREDGTASVPISISVLVVGVTPTDTPVPEPESEPEAESEDDTETASAAIVRTTSGLNVRFGPSVNCDILGQYPEAAEVEVLAKSQDGAWLKVVFGTGVGWMSSFYTDVLTSLDNVPTEQGPFCEPPAPEPEPPTVEPPGASCGDLTCDPGENFANCPGDCNTCGNATCDPGESFGNCPGDCKCGNAVCDPGEDAASCPGDCKCGNGVCEPEYGEAFDTYGVDCLIIIDPGLIQILPICGNSTVDAGEQCDPPGSLCGFWPNLGTCSDTCTCNS